MVEIAPVFFIFFKHEGKVFEFYLTSKIHVRGRFHCCRRDQQVQTWIFRASKIVIEFASCRIYARFTTTDCKPFRPLPFSELKFSGTLLCYGEGPETESILVFNALGRWFIFCEVYCPSIEQWNFCKNKIGLQIVKENFLYKLFNYFSNFF